MSVYRLQDLLIDVSRQRVQREGVALEVAGLSFQLLRYLLEQGERVVSFDELIEQVWSPAVVNEETVTQRVKLLRDALGDDGRRPRYLRSVRGRGYQLCSPPQLLPPAVVSTGHASSGGRSARRWWWLTLAALAGIAAFAGLRWRDAGPPAATAIATPGSGLLQRAAYYAGIGQRDNNLRAIALYQQALAEDPENLAGLIGLSRAYSARVCLYNDPPQWAQQAQELAERALKLDPEHAPAHAALGYSHDCRGHLDQALQGYEQALRLDPAADASRASAAYLYDRKGRLAEALIANTSLQGDPAKIRFLELQIAGNLDLLGYPQAAQARYRRSFQWYPDNVFSNLAWPRFLFRQGRLSEARSALDEAFLRGTAHADLHLLAAELAMVEGQPQMAVQALQQAVALRPQASLPTTLLALHAGELDRDWARQRARRLSAALEQGAGYPGDWLEVMQLYAAVGDREAAVFALERAVASGYSDVAELRTSPFMRGLSDDPAFARAIDTIHQRIGQERSKVPAALLEELTAAPSADSR